jgi:hypothetical protein
LGAVPNRKGRTTGKNGHKKKTTERVGVSLGSQKKNKNKNGRIGARQRARDETRQDDEARIHKKRDSVPVRNRPFADWKGGPPHTFVSYAKSHMGPRPLPRASARAQTPGSRLQAPTSRLAEARISEGCMNSVSTYIHTYLYKKRKRGTSPEDWYVRSTARTARTARKGERGGAARVDRPRRAPAEPRRSSGHPALFAGPARCRAVRERP